MSRLQSHKPIRLIALAGLVGYFLLPWFGVDYGVFERDWLDAGGLFSKAGAAGAGQAVWFGRIDVALAGLALLIAVFADRLALPAKAVLAIVGIGLLSVLVPAFTERWLGVLLVSSEHGTPFGYGSFVACTSLFLIAATVWSRIGRTNRDAFVTCSIAVIVALIAVFVFYPILHILGRAIVVDEGSVSNVSSDLLNGNLWSVRCLWGGSCGVVINTLILGLMTAASTTVLGLSFALMMTRSRFPAKPLLRALTVLPVITPPFVVGLALILLFGRSGWITSFAADVLGIEATRWFYGFFGVWLGQTLSFTPIAFLVMIGVVQGVSPSLEEAAQVLRADAATTMRTISLPLFRPGIANAFLLGFIESLADFGNPLVLGGQFGVLSTEIYFAVVGAQSDPSRAAMLSILLLMLTLGVFLLQRRWVGSGSYATITGKADNGAHAPLAKSHAGFIYALCLPWLALTVTVYAMIIYGSFVKLWGRDHALTLEHYATAFGITLDGSGLALSGVAWDSFITTMSISAVAAPLTAAIGMLTAWLLTRQQFPGKNAFEFATMLSFAIPGTVVGVSYILAFNVAPIELTGTGIILVLCFMFRNMPVGVRGGIAALKQIDRSLDEASLTLGGTSWQTFIHIVVPLLRPAIVAAVAYAFIRAITSVSAVIFLVSAEHNMATSYIIGLVENGEYGVAVAYATTLIFVMLIVVLVVQAAFGARRLRRVERVAHA